MPPSSYPSESCGDSADEAWYREGLRFECTQCGECCSGEPGYVFVDPKEIETMAVALDLDVDEFESEYVRRVGLRKSLKEFEDGDCILLDRVTRKCKVYAGRPIQCQTWPFWDSTVTTPEYWEETCAVCPGSGQGKLYSFAEIEIQRRRKSV